MKKDGLETYLYSTIGVAAMLVILVSINIIGSRFKQRVDLTADHGYTLSTATRKILARLDTPVQVRFYCSRSNSHMPVMLKTYSQRVEDLLGEYRQASKGQIEIQKLDPEPDSDAEDSAKLDGIEGQMLAEGERVYLGVSVSMLDQKEALPFLPPSREPLLEYELTRAISRVMEPEKPVIGVMSPLPVSGQMNPMMMQMGRRGEPPWAFYSELERDFTVKKIEMTAESIPDDVKVLVLIHPKAISDVAEYAIDQFVLRGGKLLAFLDPLAALDRAGSAPGASNASSIDKLLKAWGLSFDTGKVVADKDFVGTTRQGRVPAVLALTDKALNKNDILTADAGSMFLIFAGAFSGTPVEGIKETVLIHSSKNSELIEPMTAQYGSEEVMSDFKASGTEFPLAIRLEGKFKTAFPEGKPKAPEPKPGAKKPEPKKPEPSAEAQLKESAQDNTVILVGDSDMIQDQIAIREVANPFGSAQRTVMPANGNLAFAQGAVEQLSGDSDLIAIRSRASRDRPFTVVKKMQTAAEENYRSKIKDLNASRAEAERRLSELQRAKPGETSQRYLLSPEQQQEIADFNHKKAEVNQQLRQVHKQLTADVDSLENRLKWANIAALPMLVALVGVTLALVRRRRCAAR